MIITITFEDTAPQSTQQQQNNDLYREYRESKLSVLIKTIVTYEYNNIQSCNLHHCVRHE